MNERAIGQWMLIHALVFSERTGVLICAALFLWDKERGFLTFSGATFVTLYIFVLGPVFGIFVYLSERFAYKQRKKSGNVPVTIDGVKKFAHVVHLFWFFPMCAAIWYSFSLYYDVIGGLTLDQGLLEYK